MTNFQKLYNGLNIEGKEKVFNTANTKSKEVYSIQKTNLDNLLNQIAKILLDEEIEGKVLKLPPQRLRILKKQLFNIISDSCKSEYDKEKAILNLLQIYSFEENYYIKQFILDKDKKPLKVPAKAIEKMKENKIKGKTAEQRIKNNKSLLEKTLKIKVLDFLNGKITVNDIKKEITKKYIQNTNNSKRLFENEIIKAQEQSDKLFRENIIKDTKLMYLATLDKKTCTDCSTFDGKIYTREKAPEVPRHVNCRCCLTEVMDDWKPNKRRDNEIVGKHIDFKSYEEWRKEKIG